MKKLMTSAAVATLAATPVLAAVTIQDLDVTGDNFATYAEVRNAIPEMDMVDFNAIDANGDNRLSAAEVTNPDAQTLLSQHQMRATKERPLWLLDPDGDGFMSYDDMVAVHPSLTLASFQSIDVNSDNRLSYEEFYRVEAQVAIAQCSESTFLAMDDLDNNGDRFLSMEELKGGYPRVTAIDFDTIDLNNDNRISAIELLAPTAECLYSKK